MLRANQNLKKLFGREQLTLVSQVLTTLVKSEIEALDQRENGSGTGLRLSRQMRPLHEGLLRVQAVPDKETNFILQFNP